MEQNAIKALPAQGGKRMSCYRAFLLDHSGRIFRAKRLYCRDDRAALALSEKLRARCWGMEVWDGRRMIGLVLPGKGEASLCWGEPDVSRATATRARAG
jgi:hypothetical protein